MQRPESAVEEAQKSFQEASKAYEKALQDALKAFPQGELAETLIVNHDDFTKATPANMKSTLEEQETKENRALAKINEPSDPSRELDDNVQVHNSKVLSELHNARRSFASARTNLDNARANQSVATAATGSTAPQPADTSATASSTSTSSPAAVETSTTASTGAAGPAVASSSARAMTPAQKTSREKAQRTKETYNRSLEETSHVLEGDNLSGLRETLNSNNAKLRRVSHGETNKSLAEMEAAENRHLGSLTNEQKGSLKQLQDNRRNYMNAAVASTQTAARHDAVAGNHPFELADKKKSVFSERSQGIIKNYVDGLRDFNPAKKVLLARREAIASKEAKASQEFLAKMEAKQSTTPDEALGALPGLTQAADSVRSTDPAAVATLDSTVSTVNEAAGADGLVGGSPKAADPGAEKTKDLTAELEKPENSNKEIVYHTQSGQHRISYNNGVFSSKNPEALAKYVAAQGYKDFQITHGDGPTALGLLDNLMKEGVQDVSMTPEMRAKIKTAGGEDQIRIADARSQTFKSTSAVEQSERSLNALTFTRMTSPEDASARATLNRDYCTHEDRQDMMGILKEKLDAGQINEQQFAQQANEVLKPSTLEERESLTANLSATQKAAIETAAIAPTPAPTTATAAVSSTSATATATSPPPPPSPSAPQANETAAPLQQGTTQPKAELKEAPKVQTHEAEVKVEQLGTATETLQRPTKPLPPNKPSTTSTAEGEAQARSAKELPHPPTPMPTAWKEATPQAQQQTAQAGQQGPQIGAHREASPTPPARPNWTNMGMGEAREHLSSANKTDNKSASLAGVISQKLSSFKDIGEAKVRMMSQYIEGIKQFLNGGENKSGTKFTDTMAALAVTDPSTVPAILPKLEPKELGEVAEKVAKHDDTDKAAKALDEMDKKGNNGKSPMDDWEEEHPKSKEKKSKAKENKDPNEQKKEDKSEVDQAKKKVDDAKKNVQEKKQEQQQQKTETHAQTPAPHGGGKA